MRYLMSLPPLVNAKLCSCPYPLRSITSNQLVFCPRKESTRDGAYCATAAANSAAFIISGSRSTDDAEALLLYSNRVPDVPFPDFVVISTTPLAAFVP